MEPLKFKLFPYPRRKVELCCFLLTRQVYSQKGLLCRSSHEVLTKMAARLLEVRRRLPVSFFFLFVINKLRFWAKIFLLEKAEFTKRLLLREYTGVVNNPSSTKLSYSKLKNAILNPSKSFLALKKVSPRILLTFKRSSSKKMGKHRAHSLSTR